MTIYSGRVKWAVRRYDTGGDPEVVVIEGYDVEAEGIARSMVNSMNEVLDRHPDWDTPKAELLRSQTQWEVVE